MNALIGLEIPGYVFLSSSKGYTVCLLMVAFGENKTKW